MTFLLIISVMSPVSKRNEMCIPNIPGQREQGEAELPLWIPKFTATS